MAERYHNVRPFVKPAIVQAAIFVIVFALAY